MKKKLYILPFQHNDLVWRRCFERDIEFDDKVFIPYADIEELYIKSSIELCEKYPEYRFQIECVAVLRKFIERNPDYKGKIKALLDSDRTYIPFTGDNIVDSNLIGGESLIRNFLYGDRYLRDNFDYTAEGFDRLDSFGNSGQIPQIARGFGQKWISNISYSECEGDYFRGIDGSTVFNLSPTTVGCAGGGVPKYPPCPDCRGKRDVDCPVCGNKRIDEEYINTYGGLLKTPYINQAALEKAELPAIITTGGEEIIPSADIIEWARENADKYDICFGFRKDFIQFFESKLQAVDCPDEAAVHNGCELNCNNTGVFVTRIKLKQGVRHLESNITAAETAAVAALLKDNDYPHDNIATAWQKAHFTMFHDAVTGTIVDDGYNEIIETMQSAEQNFEKIKQNAVSGMLEQKSETVTVFNPCGNEFSGIVNAIISTKCDISLAGEDNPSITDYSFDGSRASISFYVKSLAAFAKREYKIIPAAVKATEQATFAYETEQSADAVLQNKSAAAAVQAENSAVIENDFYTVSASTNGIDEIKLKVNGKITAKAGEYRIGEWILEHEEGSPWATLSTDMTRQPLSHYTKLVSIEKTDTVQKLTFEVQPDSLATYSIHGARGSYSLALVKDSPMLYFTADVRWDTQNYRLRIAFPTKSDGKHIYEIPYGKIERKPYKNNIMRENGSANWASAAGDYPAHNWAGIEGDITTALFNKGTPSYLIEKDSTGNESIFLTVLRSPSVATYLHSPNEYTMTKYDGMRDVGEHRFEYALCYYENGFDENSAVADGISYNAAPITVNGSLSVPQLPTINASGVRISAVKAAEDGSGIVLRLVEYRGKGESFTLNVPDYAKSVTLTDMKEGNLREITVKNGKAELSTEPYKILTVKIKL